MAFADLGSLGATGSTGNNQTTLDLTTTAAVAAGELVVVVVAADNIANGGDDGAVISVTFLGVQALTKGKQIANALAAQAGASSSLWYCVASSAFASGSTIRATFGSGTLVDASGLTARHFSLAANNTAVEEGTAGTLVSNTAADPGSLNVTTASIACLRVRGIASQVGNNTNLTPTSTWTAWANGNSATTGTTGEICARAEHLISTATGAASDPTYVSAIYASVYVAFKEQLLPITGTGPLSQAQAADVDGAGVSSSEGTGTPAAQAADVDGTGTITSVGGDWVTVWEFLPDGRSLNPGWAGYTIVGFIPLADFSATGGSEIRLTLAAPWGGEPTEYSALYIGNGGGSDAFDFGETPTRIFVSSSGTISIPVGDTPVVSDAAAFVKDSTNSLVFAAQYENASADTLVYQAASLGTRAFYKGSVEAGTVDKSGYTGMTSGIPFLAKIEFFIGAPSEIEGDGALAAQTAAVAGSGETVATGTGTAIAASAIVSGAAVSSSDGTGTLPVQSAVASGAAVSSSDGTGLVNAQAAEIAGAGTAAAANSGVLQAQAAAVAGAGAVVSTGTGSLTAQSADADGIGISGSSGSSALTAQASAVAGAGVSETSGTGSLAAQPSTVAGADLVGPATGTGTLAVVAAAVAGVGDSSSSGTGAANDNDAAVAGSGVAQWIATGALVAGPASVFGTQGMAGAGALAAGSAAITGVGEAFVTPTLAGQTIVLAADDRRIELAADNRTITLTADNRRITLNADNRVIVVPADDRKLEAA